MQDLSSVITMNLATLSLCFESSLPITAKMTIRQCLGIELGLIHGKYGSKLFRKLMNNCDIFSKGQV
jgi:hypothetical protein